MTFALQEEIEKAFKPGEKQIVVSALIASPLEQFLALEHASHKKEAGT